MKVFKYGMLATTFILGLMSTQPTYSNSKKSFLHTTFHTISNETNLFGKHFIIALIVHYLGQSCTNLLYKSVPLISESIVRPGISLCQTLSSHSITNEVYNKVSDHHHSFPHFLGWVVATYLPKAASIVLDTIDKYRINQTLEKNQN